MAARAHPVMAVELGRRRFVALSGRLRGGALVVEREIRATLPAAIERDDASAVGAFVAERLAELHAPRGPVVLVLPREAVAGRRLELPGAAVHELPGMVRLAMLRELPTEGAAVVDFIEVPPAEGTPVVFAVAAPRAALGPACDALEAAGRRVGAASLRTLAAVAVASRAADGVSDGPAPGGSSATVDSHAEVAAARPAPAVATPSSTSAPPMLVIDVSGESVEFAVVERGQIVFSRGAALRLDAETPEALADAAVGEAKRTWLSYRAGLDGRAGGAFGGGPGSGSGSGPASAAGAGGASERGAIADAALVADAEVAKRALPALRELLGVAVRLVEAPANLQSTTPLGSSLPLAEALRTALAREATIDLVHPRKAPDLPARRRQLVLAATGLLVLAALGGYTLGRREAQRETERRADIYDKAKRFAPEGRRMRRDEDKLRHLQQWSLPPQDWIADLLHVKSMLPAPGDVVIDTFSGAEDFKGVRWDKEKGWSSAAEVRIVLEGEAKTRAIADALRDRLVADKQFVVTTSGSDTRGGNRLSSPFGYLMRSDRRAGAGPSAIANGAESGRAPERSAAAGGAGAGAEPKAGSGAASTAGAAPEGAP
ncbi:MAG: hypothetical protein U0575_10515 [Phycisphaerales bacterium]